MPALEMAQENGKLLAWRKKEGERVIKGEPLLEIETDKAIVEVEAPGDGILAGITADVGAVVPGGQTIAWLVAPGEKPPAMTVKAAPAARASSSPERARAAAAGLRLRKRLTTVWEWHCKFRRRPGGWLKNLAWTSARFEEQGRMGRSRRKMCRVSPMERAPLLP